MNSPTTPHDGDPVLRIMRIRRHFETDAAAAAYIRISETTMRAMLRGARVRASTDIKVAAALHALTANVETTDGEVEEERGDEDGGGDDRQDRGV